LNVKEGIELQISEDLKRTMETRGIRRNDVEEVIRHAENTGEKFVHTETGRSLASLKLNRVTYWVEYNASGEESVVHRAYSHRMEMKRGTGS
jgi:hypothetical protein